MIAYNNAVPTRTANTTALPMLRSSDAPSTERPAPGAAALPASVGVAVASAASDDTSEATDWALWSADEAAAAAVPVAVETTLWALSTAALAELKALSKTLEAAEPKLEATDDASDRTEEPALAASPVAVDRAPEASEPRLDATLSPALWSDDAMAPPEVRAPVTAVEASLPTLSSTELAPPTSESMLELAPPTSESMLELAPFTNESKPLSAASMPPSMTAGGVIWGARGSCWAALARARLAVRTVAVEKCIFGGCVFVVLV